MRTVAVGINKWLCFLSFSFFTPQVFAQVWANTNKWNDKWEDKYSQYIVREINTEWVKRTDTIASGYLLDCARFIYFVRLNFAYQNKLPFSFSDTKSNKLISNTTFKVNQKLSEGERLKLFAAKLFETANSYSLAQDTFLVPLNNKYFKPGLILLGDFKKRHSWLLKKITPSMIPTFIFSTMPRSDFLYETYVYPTAESAFPGKKNPTLNEGGFRQFLWPEEYKIKSNRARLDQVKLIYSQFFENIQKKLQTEPRNPDEEFNYLLEDVCIKMRIRANVIIDTEHFKNSLRGRLMTEAEREAHSTPSRDSDLYSMFQRIDHFVREKSTQLSPLSHSKYGTLLYPKYLSNDFCYVQWAVNKTEPLGILRRRLFQGKLSSDAQDGYAQRWGDWNPASYRH